MSPYRSEDSLLWTGAGKLPEKGWVKRTKLRKDKRENKISLPIDVVGIEVTRPIRKESGPSASFYRTIRFRLFGGVVLDVFCSGAKEKYIKLRSVKKLKPVKKPTPIRWLTPKVYKGTSDREHGLLQWIRKLFS